MPITIENKCGLILGVANERSIAWGISKVLSNSGAEIALSYQNENLLKRVGPLADSEECTSMYAQGKSLISANLL